MHELLEQEQEFFQAIEAHIVLEFDDADFDFNYVDYGLDHLD